MLGDEEKAKLLVAFERRWSEFVEYVATCVV